MAASSHIHVFLEFFLPELRTILFPSHCVLSHITIVETIGSGEREMNPVTLTINNPPDRKLAEPGDQTSDLLFSSPKELRGLGADFLNINITQPPIVVFSQSEDVILFELKPNLVGWLYWGLTPP